MTAYNVINRPALASGQPEDISIVLANFDALAAILNGQLDVGNLSPAAGILAAQLAGNIPGSKLAGYPADGSKYFDGLGGWTSPALVTDLNGLVTINNSIAETDLLGGGIAIPANALGPNGHADLVCIGDFVNNTGAAQASHRFKLKLGGGATIIFDTGADPSNNGGAKPLTFGATRYGFIFRIRIQNVLATNVQAVWFELKTDHIGWSTGPQFTVGEAGWNPMTNNGNHYGADGYNAAAIDTTADCPVVLTCINPVASANFETKAIISKLTIVK